MTPLIVSLLLSVSAAPLAPPPLIVIDPGHGGAQKGAIGACDVEEKSVTLAISIQLARLLHTSGRARVLLTRTTDTTLELSERTRLANKAQARLFISIHANASSSPDHHGVETYFLSRTSSNKRAAQTAHRENENAQPQNGKAVHNLDFILKQLHHNADHRESQALAVHLEKSLQYSLEARGRGVLQAPFIVLVEAQMPAVLVEVGFLTNPKECERLTQNKYQAKVAHALSTAILSHLARRPAAPKERALAR